MNCYVKECLYYFRETVENWWNRCLPFHNNLKNLNLNEYIHL